MCLFLNTFGIVVKLMFLLQVGDLLVAMCRAALLSPRRDLIFEPYPTVVDPLKPTTLAFSPKVSAKLISDDFNVYLSEP